MGSDLRHFFLSTARDPAAVSQPVQGLGALTPKSEMELRVWVWVYAGLRLGLRLTNSDQTPPQNTYLFVYECVRICTCVYIYML